MKVKIMTICSLLFSLHPTALLAQEEADYSVQENDSNKPYEVVITGRPTKAYYRELIQKVEEDFFAKFNELNIDDAYDMYCYEYTPTMSHIKKRACEPLFMIRQRANDGAEIAFAFGVGGVDLASGVGNGAVGGLTNNTENARRQNRKKDYDVLVKKLEELTRTNEELAEIANVMEQLKYRLETYSGN